LDSRISLRELPLELLEPSTALGDLTFEREHLRCTRGEVAVALLGGRRLRGDTTVTFEQHRARRREFALERRHGIRALEEIPLEGLGYTRTLLVLAISFGEEICQIGNL